MEGNQGNHQRSRPTWERGNDDAGGTILSALVMENTFQICAIYPLVNVYITMERSTILNGSINYFFGSFSIAMLVYRRVYIYTH